MPEMPLQTGENRFQSVQKKQSSVVILFPARKLTHPQYAAAEPRGHSVINRESTGLRGTNVTAKVSLAVFCNDFLDRHRGHLYRTGVPGSNWVMES